MRTTPWWKLRQADVGTPLGFAPARIPLLEEVLDALPAHFLVNIELKCDDVEDLGLARKVAELVRRRELAERVVVSSFNPLCLVRLATAFPSLRRGFLIDPDRAWAPQAWTRAAPAAVNMPLSLIAVTCGGNLGMRRSLRPRSHLKMARTPRFNTTVRVNRRRRRAGSCVLPMVKRESDRTRMGANEPGLSVGRAGLMDCERR